MKKRILLLLAAVLCVSLCACGGSKSSESAESAEALEQNQKESETEADTNEFDESEIVGIWKNISAYEFGLEIVFNEDGTAIKKYNEEEYKYTWKRNEDEIILSSDEGLHDYITINNADKENLELYSGATRQTFISEKAFQDTIKTIDFSLDNWQDYFEFKEVVWVYRDAFDEIENVVIDKKMCIKEAYSDKIITIDAAVEFTTNNRQICWVECNTETGNITATPCDIETVIERLQYTGEEKIRVEALIDSDFTGLDTSVSEPREFDYDNIEDGLYADAYNLRAYIENGIMVEGVGVRRNEIDVTRIEGMMIIRE